MKTLIEIHLLQNFAPSNLNRDDTGAPKDALFGGTRRARVSSQCFKRATRQHFSSMVESGSMVDEDFGVRTSRMLELVSSALVEMGRSVEEAQIKAKQALGALNLKFNDNNTQYLLFLGKQEIRGVAQIINEKWDSIDESIAENESQEKTSKKKKKSKPSDADLKKALTVILNGGKAVDVALFGRMIADMPAGNQYAACQVAHSISTHSVEREFDFFTGSDDLQQEDSSGANMLGTIEFNSACYYRYSNIDFDKLLENLQGDYDLAHKGLRAFLEAFIVATPSGKQNSFASHNPPEFVVISVRNSGGPRNLANAFETAIRAKAGESLTYNSADQLVKKANSLNEAFGGGDKTFILNLIGVDSSNLGSDVGSLKELLDKTLVSIKG